MIANNEPWMADAACASADPEGWFPDGRSSGREAKRICRGCPVIAQCLRYALTHGERGIWGGTSARERAAMLGEVA